MTGRHPRWPSPYGTRREAPATPAPGSVPVTAIILARNESPNIVRAVRSVGWCEQVVVVDSGSADDTVHLARAAGATVWREPWRGFSAQRQWAMSRPEVHHDWVYFLDADEWVSVELATEIARRLGTADCAAYTQRRRLVFEGRWIAHCGWYANSWQARLLDRRVASFDASVAYGERATVLGAVHRLSADLVDEDRKGLAAWLTKHVHYAELEAERRLAQPGGTDRLGSVWRALRHPGSTRPLGRTLAKDVVFPLMPAKPAILFLYMYVLRGGWRDGRSGLLFCLYYAWYELTVGALGRSYRAGRRPVPAAGPLPAGTRPAAPPPAGTVPDGTVPDGTVPAAFPAPRTAEADQAPPPTAAPAPGLAPRPARVPGRAARR